MLNILLLILGTTLAHRGHGHGRGGGRRCREELVDPNTQVSDLTKLLLPFTGVASDDDGSETPDDTETDIVMLSDDSGRRFLQDLATTCVMRGLDRSWPHEEAVAAPAERRLLRWGRRRKQKVKFDVDNSAFGPLSAMKRRNEFDCISDGSVQFSYKTSVMTVPETIIRRELRRGQGHDSSSEESEEDAVVLPFATLTLTQTNAFTDGVDPVEIDMSMDCHPWYQLEETTADGSEETTETCTLRGMMCKDGEYTYFDDSQDQEDEDFWGMKCSTESDFYDDWQECVVDAI